MGRDSTKKQLRAVLSRASPFVVACHRHALQDRHTLLDGDKTYGSFTDLYKIAVNIMVWKHNKMRYNLLSMISKIFKYKKLNITSSPNASEQKHAIDRIFMENPQKSLEVLNEQIAARMCIHEAGHYVYALKSKSSGSFIINDVRLGNLNDYLKNGGNAGGVNVEISNVSPGCVKDFWLAGAVGEVVAQRPQSLSVIQSKMLHAHASRRDIHCIIERNYFIPALPAESEDLIYDNSKRIDVLLEYILKTYAMNTYDLISGNIDTLKAASKTFYDLWSAQNFENIVISPSTLPPNLR